jgi:electron transport complex protein RnfC
LGDLLAFCGGQASDPGKILCGGPMMGIALDSLEPGIDKTTSGLLLFHASRVHCYTSMPCIRCSRCVRACPMHLLPCTLSETIEAEDYASAENIQVMDCIECGSCAYVCPAHRPLVQHMKQGKTRVAWMREKRKSTMAETR